MSSSVSPLLTELAFWVNSMTSALSRLAAREKLFRVRVLSSKNRLTTTLPRSGGAFLIERVLICSKPLAVSRMWFDLLDAQVPQAQQVLSLPLEWFAAFVNHRHSCVVPLSSPAGCVPIHNVEDATHMPLPIFGSDEAS